MPKQAIMETNQGTLTIELFDSETPKTVENFEKLAAKGYYDGVVFHRVISDFMIQGGDPTGTGTGGPGYEIECEIRGKLKHDGKGVLSMAHKGQCKHDPESGAKLNGNCSGGSQFFITHGPTPHLDGIHTVFGKVVSGLDVVDKIVKGDKIIKVEVK